jgi:dolichyl-phosphate beta-glucosyltransferase
VLGQIHDSLIACDAPSEVVVVDDGSADQTAQLTRAFVTDHPSFRLIQTHHGGKAHALVSGMRAATGRIVLLCDMDQATPIGEASKLLPWFDRGFDIVIGSRGFERRHAPISRVLISYGQLLARHAVLRFGDIVDTQCGFKAFRREIVEPLLDRLVVYAGAREQRASGARLSPGFDVEILFAARKRGYAIKEVPVQWDHRRGREARLVWDCVRGLADLLAIRAADREGRYNRRSDRDAPL